MAEISIVKFSELDNKEFILSSEYYNPFVIELDRKYKISSSVLPLMDICIKNGVRDFGSFSLYNKITYMDKSSKTGIPFLRVNDISESYVNLKNTLKIDNSSHEILKKSQVNKNDLLFSIIGTLGICSMMTDSHLCNSNQNLAKITIDKNKANPYYVAIYLNSEIGKRLSLRGESGGVQKHITLGRTKNIPIYLLNKVKQDKIGNLYSESLRLMKEAIIKYEDAEKELLNEIGLSGLNIKEEKTFSGTFNDINTFQRIDADFFQPKYDYIINRIKSYKNGCSTIINKFEINKEPFEKNEKFIYNYVEIGSLNIFNLKITPVINNFFELPDNCKVKLNKGDLLISKVRPYRGAISIIEEDIENLVGSTAFTILKENSNYKKEILLLLLKTKHYQELLMKYNVGTSYPVVKDEDVLNLPIPLIKDKIQEKLSNKIKNFFSLRNESEKKLTQAKELLFNEINKELNLQIFLN